MGLKQRTKVHLKVLSEHDTALGLSVYLFISHASTLCVKESYLSLAMIWREFDLLGRGWGHRVVCVCVWRGVTHTQPFMIYQNTSDKMDGILPEAVVSEHALLTINGQSL